MKDTPSRIHATAKTVDGEISVSLRSIAASRLADVSFTPVWIWYVQGGLGYFNSQLITFVLYELLSSCASRNLLCGIRVFLFYFSPPSFFLFLCGWRKLHNFCIFFFRVAAAANRAKRERRRKRGDGTLSQVAIWADLRMPQVGKKTGNCVAPGAW